MKKLIVLFGPAIALICYSQKTAHYNLSQLLKNHGLISDTSNHAQALNDPAHAQAISTQRILWLKNVSFNQGTIDVDIRGKDVFLQSFLGICFHGKDKDHYDVVYFRPFNFRHPDTARRKWSVQYMVVPEFLYDKLRKEHTGVYENSVTPVPKADEWFHATIIVKGDDIRVYVNHSSTPSLQVKKLNNVHDGMLGLWDDELSGDFANLVITQD
ncbi:MAG: hypothetical protein ACHQET_11720 [Chitinophagales bacterium]